MLLPSTCVVLLLPGVWASSGAPVIGDRIHLFYTAGNGPFMGSRAAGFSMATLQRDWWFGYTPTANISTFATIVTTSMTVGSSGRLLVSADARRGGVSVGVVATSPIKRLAVENILCESTRQPHGCGSAVEVD